MSPNNGGGVGLAYGAKIMAIKAGQSTGSFASSDIAKAVKYAADNGADVINMSFGGISKSYLVEEALIDASHDCVLVAAAGNDSAPTADGGGIDIYPAGYNYVIGVMAADNSGNLAKFSNWDFIIGENCEYELAAPGVNIYSTLPGDRYACWSGTSMAAPNVAAAAAIIRSKYTDKNKYTSRFIMGQLVSATSSIANMLRRFIIIVIYPRAMI
ncbi:Subtilase family protein [Ruminococcus flavefaciens]|uniref:Subtilase family protein n=2 Tax=Ruminococcus flavefaciens TaxID=1265 RepID=A0A1H6KFQ9_RUMFL|nr:Subtilase family protein [Ruminococcus flavefaciens]